MPQFQTISTDEATFITAFVEGYGLRTMRDDHPNFDLVSNWLDQDHDTLDPNVIGPLFDPAEAIRKGFERVTERVTLRGETIYFDGDAMHGALTDLILRLMKDGEDFTPFVLFLEKVMQNPIEKSRDMLFDWVQAAGDGMAITDSGDLVGFKGAPRGSNDAFRSTYAGHAIVNGKEFFNVYIPYAVGDTVEMPRSEVTFDPRKSCSSGLHVGTRSYACGFRGIDGAVLEVHVNPRDVVSVPEYEHAKVRVCRFFIAGIDEGQDYASLVRTRHEEDEIDDFDEIDEIDDLVDEYFGGGDEEEPSEDGGADDEADEAWEIVSGISHRTLRNPTQEEYDNMYARARRRHRGFETYATTIGGWNRVSGKFASDPEGWLVEA